MWRATGGLAGGNIANEVMGQGGGVFGRLRHLAFFALHWTLEPLGYLPRALRDAVLGAFKIRDLTAALGVPWQVAMAPNGGIDSTRTGVVSAWLGLALLWCFPPRERWMWLAVLLLGFVGLHAAFAPQAFASRFTVVLLALFVVAVAASPFWWQRRRWWLLAAAVALTTGGSLLGTVLWTGRAMSAWRRDKQVEPGLPNAAERAALARQLDGAPLLVLAEGGDQSALRAGVEGALRFRCVTCPAAGDWTSHLGAMARESPRLYVLHKGRPRLLSGLTFDVPGQTACPPVPVDDLRRAAEAAGWRHLAGPAGADVFGR